MTLLVRNDTNALGDLYSYLHLVVFTTTFIFSFLTLGRCVYLMTRPELIAECVRGRFK